MKRTFLRILMPFLGFVALAGCTKPGVDVGSLGKLVQAPQLKSGGVADNNFGDGDDQQKYLSFGGSCDTHVTKMQIGFSLSGSSAITYNDIPATSDYYANPSDTTTTHFVNKTNCSDGTFSFILSLAQVETFLGLGTGQTLDDIDVTDVYLVGVTTLGNTMPLVLPTGSGGNGGSGKATQLRLTKMDPAGFAPAGYCDALTVYLSDDSGNYASSISSPIPFSLTSTTAGGTSSAATLYSSLENCKNSVSPSTLLSLPAGSNSLQVYTHFSGAVGSFANFAVNSTAVLNSLGLSPGGSYTVTLRGTSNRWIQINDLPQTLYKNECYAGSASFYKYTDDFTIDSTYASSVTMNFSSASTAFTVYLDSSCLTPVTSIPMHAAGTLNFYVKYTSSAISDTFVDFSMITTATSSVGLVVDSPTRSLRADLSSHTAITSLSFQGPNQISTGVCNLYNLVARNQNGTAIANSTASLNIGLSAAGGSFYSDSGCSSTIAEATLPVGAYSAAVYYKSPSGTADGAYILNANISGGTGTNYLVNILHAPVVAEGIGGSILDVTAVGACLRVNVILRDSSNTFSVTPDANTNVTFTTSGPGKVYMSASCTDTGQSSGSFIIPGGQSSMMVYLMETSSGGGVVQFVLPGITSATLAY